MRTLIAALFSLSAFSCKSRDKACTDHATGLIPVYDLADSSFEGFSGGLYPWGNEIPDFWLQKGLEASGDLIPRGVSGSADTTGKIGFLTLGYSTAAMTARVFYDLCADSSVFTDLSFVTGAQAGLDLSAMTDRTGPYWDSVQARIQEAGMIPEQIQLVWLSSACQELYDRPFPVQATDQIPIYRQVLANIRYHFPQTCIVFLSDRAFAGYISEKGAEKLGEPSAYYTSWAVKWTIEDLMMFPSDSIPYTDWGPALWTDGIRGNAEGYTWSCAEAGKGGIHPTAEGRLKEAMLLYRFFTSSPYLQQLR